MLSATAVLRSAGRKRPLQVASAARCGSLHTKAHLLALPSAGSSAYPAGSPSRQFGGGGHSSSSSGHHDAAHGHAEGACFFFCIYLFGFIFCCVKHFFFFLIWLICLWWD